MENITNAHYKHAKKVKNLGNFHDLYVQSNTLLLADAFESFRNNNIYIYLYDNIIL